MSHLLFSFVFLALVLPSMMVKQVAQLKNVQWHECVLLGLVTKSTIVEHQAERKHLIIFESPSIVSKFPDHAHQNISEAIKIVKL